MRKFLICILAVITALNVPLFASAEETGYSPDFDVSAQAVFMYNLDTESVIMNKNADDLMYPASLTKIMTCVLAMEKIQNLETEIITYPGYVQDYLYNYQYVLGNGEVSKGGLMAGEQLAMKDALYALMLPSANEVAMIIADHIGGSQQGFVQMMNARAKELGLQNTNFVNPNGLFDPAHVTTARDMYVLSRHAMTIPGFMDIVSAISYRCPPTNKHDSIYWETTNQLMVPESSYYAPSVKGIKTGSLPDAGRCLVSTATKDGFTYLLVVLGSEYTSESGAQMAFVDTKNLYQWAFDTFRVKNLVDKGKYVAEVTLNLNMDRDHVTLMTADRVTALLPNDIDNSGVVLVPNIPQSVDAPVKKSDKAGEASIMLFGEEVGKVDLLFAESIEASPILVTIEKIKAVTRTFWFKFTVIMIVFLIIFYIVLMLIRNRNLRRRGYRPRRRL